PSCTVTTPIASPGSSAPAAPPVVVAVAGAVAAACAVPITTGWKPPSAWSCCRQSANTFCWRAGTGPGRIPASAVAAKSRGLVAQRAGADRVLGDDDEQRGVDRVEALAQHRALAAALAAVVEEAPRILEVVAVDDAAERLVGGERLAVARVDVAEPALRDEHERQLVHAVLPREEAEVHAAAQQVRGEAGLAARREHAAL